MKVKVIHGPNLHLLGRREKDIYGELSLDDINRELEKYAEKLGIEVLCDQFNSEGAIVEAIGQLGEEGYDALIINPAAYTHTSIAILDALRACEVPAIEVHLSNIASREEYRKVSITAEAVVGQIAGFGKDSYVLALQAVQRILRSKEKK